jgi:signal transduction histidine kinase
MSSPEHPPLREAVWIADPASTRRVASDHALGRSRVLEVAILALCGVGLLSFVHYLVLGILEMSLALAISVAAGIANLVLLRCTNRNVLCGHLGLAVLTSLLLFTSAGSGGFRDPTFAWFYVLPLAAAVILGFRGAVVWLGVTLAITLAFSWLDSHGMAPPNRIPVEIATAHGLFSRVTAILALFAVALSFVTGQRRAERRLARANAELRRESAYVRLLECAAVAANEAATLDDAMEAGVRRICAAMGWPVGHIYAVEAEGILQRSGSFVAENDEPLRSSGERLLGTTSPTAEDLPVRALASGRPEACDDLFETTDQPGAENARQLGLGAALAVPVLTHGRVVAVLEFGLRERMASDSRLLEILAFVGTQIGRVAERAAVQQRFRQAQKMEAIGRLSAGVAHEINNPMAYVRSNLCQLGSEWNELRSRIEKLEGSSPFTTCLEDCEEIIEETLEGVERTVAIVRDMKKFSHTGGDEREPTDLHEVVETAIRVASSQAPSGVSLHHREGGDLPPVPCAANQIQQVLVNLMVNAIEAVSPNGWIEVATTVEGDFAVIQVEDDGPGMNDATRKRLFDPFFTTKQAGDGTGLGLAISNEIVRSHAGEIRVISALGAGTVMEVRLPLEAPGRSADSEPAPAAGTLSAP